MFGKIQYTYLPRMYNSGTDKGVFRSEFTFVIVKKRKRQKRRILFYAKQ